MAGGKRLYRNVLNKMLDLIDRGEFPAGGRLPPERELAERFDVSRPTIREAIIALETLDRVEVKTGSGIYVLDHHLNSGNGIEHISPFELTESRALIEGEAAALAASHINAAELQELEDSLYEMAQENEDGELAEGDADKKFHHIIAQATRNAMLVTIIEHMWHVRNNAPIVARAYKAICDQDGLKRVEEHREIYQALVNRDPGAARAAMHQHFALILNKLIATSEAEQVEEARRKAAEVRKRFSLEHLVKQA
ncbi:MAG: FadR family transcriptional regulator [Xanthomonadales bacterium]|nr:FadR family transcriptional regulator [Gammaproteobacteria bacterium]MBT8074380.1 FadR family transcriptional regulator [Gammaproteobacteria bacterium]NNK05232.1 FadR family transcriptional regulator [Xanthomonadales bacterium]NNK97835.1 FadR family transcriptional regulator [Xanthomonadales bacterium]